MPKLDKEILLKTLRGYAEVNKITEAELRKSLPNVTRVESWATFEALYEFWERTGQQAGGDWEALAKQKLAEQIALRQAFEKAARAKGLI